MSSLKINISKRPEILYENLTFKDLHNMKLRLCDEFAKSELQFRIFRIYPGKIVSKDAEIDEVVYQDYSGRIWTRKYIIEGLKNGCIKIIK